VHPTVYLARQMAMAGWTSAGEGSNEQAIRSGTPEADIGRVVGRVTKRPAYGKMGKSVESLSVVESCRGTLLWLRPMK
jgi:hypothetical protein